MRPVFAVLEERLSRVLIAGLCPLPFEDALRNEGPGIRTWQFALGLVRAGHHVQLVAWRIPEAYGPIQPPATETREGVSIERVDEASFFDPATITRTIDRLDPDALVGATIHGSYALARCRTELPFWADQFGHTMAEAQAKAALDGNNAVLAYYWRRVEAVMRRADRISVVSRRQRYAAIGELGAMGRLSHETCGHDLVSVIPCAVVPGFEMAREALDRDASQPFTVLWSGGFNVWADVDTLFRGLEAAMARVPRLRFIATGSSIPGQDPSTYPRFSRLVAASPQPDRFQLAGWVRSEDLVRYIAEADLGVLAERSIYEGELGSKNRVVQWMAAGLPVAYNRVGDLGDAIHERKLGLTFTAGDASGLADCLVWAADHRPELQAMAAAARGVALHDFSVENTTRPLAEWAAAASHAPDATTRRRVRSPRDHAPLRNRLVSLAEKAGVARLLRGGVRLTGRAKLAPSASFTPYGVALLLLLPSLVWIVSDRSVFSWDQAWYAWNSVDLHEAWRAGLRQWLYAMKYVLRYKPPAVVWIGQWFVPVGRVLGSLDAGLLLSVWLTHVAALVLVWKALFALGRRRDLALLGVLSMSAAPLFIWVTNQYMAEACQTLAVAWFVWIMSQAHRWSRSRIAAHLLGATAFAMLAKASSPLFCLGPGLLAVWYLIRARASSLVDQRAPERILPLALGAITAAAALGWYAYNFRGVLAHASVASSGPIAELFGKRESLSATALFWLWAAERNFFLSWVAGTLAVAAVVGAFRRFTHAVPNNRRFDACALVSGLEILVVLACFSLSSNRDKRYLSPLLPHVALVLSWAASGIGSASAIRVLLAVLGMQWGYAHLGTFGAWGPHERGVLVQPLDRDPRHASIAAAVVSRTCDAASQGRTNLVGVDLPWFNGNSLSYAGAKLRVQAGLPYRCEYVSLAYKSVDSLRPWLETLRLRYWITLDPARYPVEPGQEFLNRTAPALFDELQAAGRLTSEPWSGPRGVLLLRIAEKPTPTP